MSVLRRYFAGRYFARDAVEELLVKWPRFKAVDAAVTEEVSQRTHFSLQDTVTPVLLGG